MGAAKKKRKVKPSDEGKDKKHDMVDTSNEKKKKKKKKRSR